MQKSANSSKTLLKSATPNDPATIRNSQQPYGSPLGLFLFENFTDAAEIVSAICTNSGMNVVGQQLEPSRPHR